MIAARSVVQLWLAASRDDALKLVNGPRHEDGVPLLVWWVPRKLVADLRRCDRVNELTGDARPGDWPRVELSLPDWKVEQENLWRFVSE
jgi:hypothetical protein